MARFTMSLLVLLLSVACVTADDKAVRPDNVDEQLWGRLVEIDRRSQRIVDLSADFVQHKHTLLLKKPIVSQGRVLVLGDAMLWQTTQPMQHSMLVMPHEVQVHYPRQKLVEIYRLQDRLADLAASPVPRLENMVRLFNIEAAPLEEDREASAPDHLRLKLTPRQSELAEHIESVVASLHVPTGTMASFELTDREGERTAVTFSDVVINKGIREQQLKLKLPTGTRVSRPLEGDRE